MRTPALALVAVLTGAALAACGTETTAPEAASGSSITPSPMSSPSPSSTPADSPAPATGARLSTSAFTLRLPRHWLNGTGDAPAGVVALGVRPGEDVVEQITVQRAGAAGPAASLKRDGATGVRAGSPAQIGGRAADHATGVGGSRGARTAQDRYTVTGGGSTWQLTFSLNRWAYRSDRERLIASVLASWSWRQ